MEPDDLKSPTPPVDAPLEAWLRAHAALPPLPDDGFTPRVMATLPPPTPRLSRRIWACLAGALAGSVVALLGTASAGRPALDPSALDLLQHPAIPASLGLAAVSLWFALRRQLQQLLRW